MPHTAGLLYEAVYPNRSLFPFGKMRFRLDDTHPENNFITNKGQFPNKSCQE
ncbi:hypothetical protein P4529_16975 [Virgibacillus pantothenticus]|uniref:hypothetical protein n=1 Tax=Virgibacillus pantothenticus TaxID=1473 RepID=UPI000AE751B4|nr:hypothetical protein [Virgibacillus pantothenticus]MED3738465.1 hypothetical protein [Virgibacillus pantothenticus]